MAATTIGATAIVASIAVSPATASNALNGYSAKVDPANLVALHSTTHTPTASTALASQAPKELAPHTFPNTVSPQQLQSYGYWMVTSNGAILSYGGNKLYGSAANMSLGGSIVGMAASAGYGGYWMAASDGSVYAFGAAPNLGTANTPPPANPVVGIASTPDGLGFWVVTSGGAVYAFGDAPNLGGMFGHFLTRPIVGIAPTFDGKGYWLVASDGGIFSYGDAAFYGSTGNLILNKPVVGMTTTPDGKGYWMVASDGGIFAYGDATFYGSTGNVSLLKPIVAMTASPDGNGYWMVASDGGIFNYGDAPFRGSAGGGLILLNPIVAMATGPGSGQGASQGYSEGIERYPSGTTGYDISWPDCNFSNPIPPPSPIEIVGINDGHGFSVNPCFSEEASWAGAGLSIYMNADFFDTSQPPPAVAQTGPMGTCSSTDMNCLGYNWGYASAEYSAQQVQLAQVTSSMWWLDVERGNTWSTNQVANSYAIKGMMDALRQQGFVVGIYSTSYQWGIITGGFQPGVPNWYATGEATDYPQFCSNGFTGGPTWLVQGQWSGSDPTYDGDYSC